MEYGVAVAWWLVLVGIAVAGLPIAATLLARLPDRGATFALPVGLAVLWLPVYLLGHLAYGPATIAAGVGVLLVVSLGLFRRGPELDGPRFAAGLVVVTVGFLFVVAVRAVDPSILPAGGEKFLDFGLLKAMLRADRLPPEDMWFAGETVNYYYGGHLLSAVLATLSGVPARYAYNLALAGFFGAFLGAVYGLAGSIAATHGRSFRVAGALGVYLAGFASNLVTPLQAVLWALPAGAAGPIAEAVAAGSALDAAALLDWGRGSRTPFYWISSRVVEGTINEFPLFAFVNGDLQGHMMSPPFLLLAAAIAFAYLRTPAGALRERRALVFAAAPAAAGLVAVVNMWSFASVPGVLWLALVFGPDPRDLLPGPIAARVPAPPEDRALDPRDELVRAGIAAVPAVVVAGLGAVWAAPFLLTAVIGTGGPPLGLGLVGDRSGLVAFLLVHGGFLAVVVPYLASRAGYGIERPARAALIVAGGLLAAVVVDAAAAAVALSVLALGWVLLRRGDDVGFEAVLVVAGAGLVLLVEVVFVAEEAGPGRMNTVFKTYAQVWSLWAVAAAVALARSLPAVPVPGRDRRARATTAAAVLLVVTLSLYGSLALGTHFRGADDPTLDATTWARSQHPDEWEAIEWLDARDGAPNVVSTPACWCDRGLPMYTWANAPSSFSGVPTLAGWRHQVGYRGHDRYMGRVDDAWTIYTGSPAERRRLLAAYDVRYVYVGPNERRVYGDDLATFDGRDGVTVAFENDAVTIYEVEPGEP